MRSPLFLLAVAAVFAMCGCAKDVHKDWMPVSGSKGDGTVKMAYTYDPRMERPQTSQLQAVTMASEKCKQWGYAKAEPFGATISNCSRFVYDMFGPICMEMAVFAEFQCLDAQPEAPETTSRPKRTK